MSTNIRELLDGLIHVTITCEKCGRGDTIVEETMALCSADAKDRGWVGCICPACQKAMMTTGENKD